MIHYHGTPLGGKQIHKAEALQGRHALVPFSYQDDMGIVADVCKSFVLDNGAFTVWRQGGELDIAGYMAWVNEWKHHPGFEWALIPDEIEGDEKANDDQVSAWQAAGFTAYGVPVWHLHESIERLQTLAKTWRTVALGSSGQWPNPGAFTWWERMNQVMEAICVAGRPVCKLHGLRMLDPDVFSRLPLSSADSTNAAVNSGSLSRYGSYLPPKVSQRFAVIADRIESVNSAPIWINHGVQAGLEL